MQLRKTCCSSTSYIITALQVYWIISPVHITDTRLPPLTTCIRENNSLSWRSLSTELFTARRLVTCPTYFVVLQTCHHEVVSDRRPPVGHITDGTVCTVSLPIKRLVQSLKSLKTDNLATNSPKGKFRRLRGLDFAPIIIEAACALHNLAMRDRDHDSELMDEDDIEPDDVTHAAHDTAASVTATSSALREAAKRKRDEIASLL